MLNWLKSAECILLMTLLFAAVAVRADQMSFSGTVVAQGDRSGIPNLTVSLTPPANSKKPKKVTTTDDKGHFALNDLENGQYLLEVYQGVTILYREVVSIPQQASKEISLRPK